jgi:hypothetical protein
MGYVARMGYVKGACMVLVRKLERKSSLVRPRRRWEHIKVNFTEIGRVLTFIHLALKREQ